MHGSTAVEELVELALVDPPAVATAVATAVAQEAVNAPGELCVVALLSPDRTLLRVAGAAPVPEQMLEVLVGEHVCLHPDDVLSEVVTSGEPSLATGRTARSLRERLTARLPAVDAAPLPAGQATALVVPLRAGGQVAGVVALFSDADPGALVPDRAAVLGRLIARGAAALAVAREVAYYRRRAIQARTLFGWSQSTSQPGGPGEAGLRALVETSAAAVRAQCWLVSRSGPGAGVVVSTDGRRTGTAAVGPPPGSRHSTPDPERPGGPGGGRGPDGHEADAVWLPVEVRGRHFGWLAAHRRACLDSDERQFLETVAILAAELWDADALAGQRDSAISELEASEESFRLAFAQAPVGMAMIRLDSGHEGEVMRVNRGLLQLTGRSEDELLSLRYGDLSDPLAQKGQRRRLAELTRGERLDDDREFQLVRPDGSRVWVRTRLAAIHRDGRPWAAVLHSQDITAERELVAQLAERALRDPLTGLGNRGMLRDHLVLALHRLPRRDGAVAVLFLDLDRFKAVNDEHGHEVGDRVLREVAARVTGAVRAVDTVARIAGDEFVIVAEVRDDAEAVLLAERVQDSLGRPVRLPEVDLTMYASIGVTTTSSADADPDELLRQADVAMYHAKHDVRPEAGSNGLRRWQVFHQALDDRSRRRNRVLRMLEAALAYDWLRLHYQPIVDLPSGRVVAAEALLRIEHPDLGLLMPADFIDVAEQHDVILPIGQWVLTQALFDLRGWRERHDVGVAVNVSARQVDRRVVRAQLDAATHAAGYPRGTALEGLWLEVTERVALEADDDVVADLEELRGLGVRLALDDFGTGYASLRHVRRLPVDELKIDRSFVDGLGRDPDDTAIVRAVTALATSLGLRTIAEGVETEEQLVALRDLGCESGQGYLLGRPVPLAELLALLEKSAVRPA